MALAPCPICSTPAVPGETFCLECGFLLTSAPGDALSEPLRPLPKLVDASGREFALQAGENIVGREGADIILPDRTVSRRHAKIVVDEGSVWVEDFGSTNGTRVRNAPLAPGQQASLADRTPLQFGSVKLTALIPEGSLRQLLALPAGAAPAAGPVASAIAAIAGGSAARVLRAGVPGAAPLALIGLRTTVGRRASNTIVIDDDSFVSGTHAEIVFEGGRFQVTDLGSTNGTKLNGRPLQPQIAETLNDGDEIMVGRTNLRFMASAAEAP
jgi:pSer/pThr/pTyr-binding forkhead associated (FHA) protein